MPQSLRALSDLPGELLLILQTQFQQFLFLEAFLISFSTSLPHYPTNRVTVINLFNVYLSCSSGAGQVPWG